MMYSIQELASKCEVPLKGIRKAMETNGYYHPDDAYITDGLSRAVSKDVMESLRRIPIKEFITRSGSLTTRGASTGDTGSIMGANYLIVAKFYDDLFLATRDYEVVPQISAQMINGWSGGPLLINISQDKKFRGVQASVGGYIADDNPSVTQATLTPILIGENMRLTQEMEEDSLPALMEWVIRKAAESLTWKETVNAIKVLAAGTDGDGSISAVTTGDTNETRFTGATTAGSDILGGFRTLGQNLFVPNTLIISNEAWGHSAGTGGTYGDVASTWHQLETPAKGFHLRFGMLDVLFHNSDPMHASTDAINAAFTKCVTLLFDRRNALISGRKRWLQINNYVDPVHDIQGAVITCRVGAVTAYNNSIFKITES